MTISPWSFCIKTSTFSSFLPIHSPHADNFIFLKYSPDSASSIDKNLCSFLLPAEQGPDPYFGFSDSPGWDSALLFSPGSSLLLPLIYIVCSVAESCLTLWGPMDCSPPGPSVLGIFQCRILEWVASSSSRGSSWPRDYTRVSCVSSLPLMPPYIMLSEMKTNCFSLHKLIFFSLHFYIRLGSSTYNSLHSPVSAFKNPHLWCENMAQC